MGRLGRLREPSRWEVPRLRRVGESLPRLGGSARVGEAFSRFGESLQLRQGLYLVSWQLTSVGAVADWLERSGTILFYAFGGLAGL